MVSIIIPYYNRPIKLQRAIDSIQNQTYKDFEIIIVDDASDIPFNISPSKNVSYIRCQENKGPGVARNIGLQKAKGEFVVFLDSDDYWNENFLKKSVAELKKYSSVIMVYAIGYSVDENEEEIKELKKVFSKSNKILPTILQYGRPWFTSACVWRKELIKDLKWIEARAWEDYAFDVSAAINCNQIYAINEALVYYDATGIDKLSNQNTYNSALEKNASIKYIAERISTSPFFYDTLIRKHMVKLILNNTIALLVNDVKNYKLYSNNIGMLKVYNGIFMSFLVFIFTHINKKLGLPLLRRLRKKI
ncbi:glycosyltransferase family 2 protein [Yeosuana sp. MJ-SS3]|uniref:Glycosyltransferase family 2 protein n=1 Tax=Gilvirhabdus luticola TaxID=3079858 RepID=A0ABU3U4Y1_9FLAO|nr:glycosyltransferase family 2 protein [Yeosuana sp. MJ-SS3]MDU8885469.1 glycosyltransferase family 2 protein [Yeosuana sp. MJ-SS3]